MKFFKPSQHKSLDILYLPILVAFAICLVVIVLSVTIAWLDKDGVRLEHLGYIFTIVGVFVNACFLWYLVRQVSLGIESNRSASKAIEESRKSRVDSRAPALSAEVHLNEVDFWFGDGKLSSDTKILKHKDKNTKVAFTLKGVLRNEGQTSAVIGATGGSLMYVVDEDRHPDKCWGYSDNVILKPGQSLSFAWGDSKTVEEWIVALNSGDPYDGSCLLSFRYHDMFHSVYDCIDVVAQGRPLQKDSDERGVFYRLDQSQFGCAIHPIQRFYHYEDVARHYKNPLTRIVSE